MEKITSRAVLGEFKRALGIEQPPAWVNLVANQFNSDQASEEYAFLDAVGPLREWVGGRNAKGFEENSLTIKNKHFEKTIEVLVRDMRRDKFGMIRANIGDIVRRAMTHPANLLSTLIINGESSTCYDGQYFFDTDHPYGEGSGAGTQSNDINCDISGLPVATAGTTTAPAVAEMQFAIAKGIQQMMGLVDSAGEPINEDMRNFIVMVPTVFFNTAIQAVATPIQVAETQSALSALKQDFTIRAVVNPRLSDWTTKFVVFNTDSYIKPLIFQRETAVNVSSKAEGSEFEFDNDAHQYGVDYWGNVAYGLYQKACLVTLT